MGRERTPSLSGIGAYGCNGGVRDVLLSCTAHSDHYAPDTMKTWHYHGSSGSTATTSEENLAELVESGAISPQTFMWTQGMGGWEPAGKVLPDLFKGAGAPPPLPPGGHSSAVAGKRSH